MVDGCNKKCSQEQDPDIGPLYQALANNEEKPLWETMLSASRETKLYRTLWNRLTCIELSTAGIAHQTPPKLDNCWFLLLIEEKYCSRHIKDLLEVTWAKNGRWSRFAVGDNGLDGLQTRDAFVADVRSVVVTKVALPQRKDSCRR